MSTNCTAAGTVRSGMTIFGERVEARVGHFHHADVRVDGAEGVVGGLGLGGGEGVEERALADVGEADDWDASSSSRSGCWTTGSICLPQ
jgi:hypothetical protein